MPVCVKKERNGPASADQTFLQRAKAPAMCTVPHTETRPPPPIPPQIGPSDNMRPKLHDQYTHHQ